MSKYKKRLDNQFDGVYIGKQDKMDAKDAPWYLWVIFALIFAGFIVGIGSMFFLGSFVLSILGTIIYEFIMIPLFLIAFDKAKYQKVSSSVKIVSGIFLGLAGFLLIGGMVTLLLIRVINPFIILGVGIIVLFLAIGLGMLIGGKRTLKKQREHCTMPVWAVLDHLEHDRKRISLLNDGDMPMVMNERGATAEITRPVWKFEYLGTEYEVSQEHWNGKNRLVEGKQYKIYINPDNPREIYVEEDSAAKLLIVMGIIWIAITVVMAVGLFGFLAYIFTQYSYYV